MTERRDLDERYAGAVQTSHLEVKPIRCDVDYLIAAGWAKDGLGTRLFRLATEWDLAGGDYRLALRRVRQVELEAMQIQRSAARNPKEAEKLLADAALLMTEAQREAITAKAMAMVYLKTLDEAKEAVGGYARWLANRSRFIQSDAVVNKLAAKALQLFLDATCSTCSGRGFSGGFNAPRVLCTTCGATGRSHYHLSKTEPNSAFVRALLAEMDMKCHRVERAMVAMLRNMKQRPAPVESAEHRALQARLAELRSHSAQED